MAIRFRILSRGLLAVALGAVAVPGSALAHGDVGEHVETYWKHMEDYAQGVERMKTALDGIVQQAREGEFDNADVDHLIDNVWEDVKVHGAIEVVTTPLYPPIWEGIYALRDAAEGGASAEAVAAAAEQTVAAMDQGLGALKFATYLHETGEGPGVASGDQPEGGAATVHAIEEDLDRVVAEYAEGESEEARELIQSTYFDRFEGIEGALIEQDADLVTTLEEDFNAGLPLLIKNGAPVAEVQAKVDAMQEKLARAESLLAEAEAGKSEVF